MVLCFSASHEKSRPKQVGFKNVANGLIPRSILLEKLFLSY